MFDKQQIFPDITETVDYLGKYFSDIKKQELVGINDSSNKKNIINKLFLELDIHPEHVVDELGNVEFSELLSSFGNKNLIDCLQLLEKEGKTFQLFKKVLNHAFFESSKKGGKFSINAYIADLKDPNFGKLIESLEYIYGNELFENIVIEVLEHGQEEFDDVAIQNLKFTQEKGFKRAIDDFSLIAGDENRSLKNLKILLANNIHIDYLKIDGPFAHEIFSGKVELGKYNALISVIEMLKKRGTKIICEFITTIEEGLQAQKMGADFFQGKFMKRENFNLTIGGVKSFSLNNKIPSFSLMNTVKVANTKNPNKIRSFSLYDEREVRSFSLTHEIQAENSNKKARSGNLVQEVIGNVIYLVSNDVNRVISVPI